MTWMEEIAKEVVGPDLAVADAAYAKIINDLFKHLEQSGG